MYYDKVNDTIRWFKQRPLVFFTILHALLFLVVFSSFDYLVGGNSYEQSFAVKILEGMVPYSDFFSEYPPLALFSFLFPALLSHTQPFYDIFFALEIFLLDFVILFILKKFISRLKLQMWPTFIIYTLCIIAMGPIVTGRFDLLPATLVLVALYAFISGKNKVAWGFLALGVSAKLYPLVIVPLFFLYLLRQQQYKQLMQGMAVFGGIILALNLPWIIIDADGFWQFLSYHLERGLHSESTYGSTLLVGQLMGLTEVRGAMTHGSWDLVSPMSENLSRLSFYVTFGLLFITYAVYTSRLWQKKLGDIFTKATLSNEAAVNMLRYTLVAVFIMLLTSKVFSPQFLIWLCPLIPLVRNRWRNATILLFLVAAAITQYIFPYNYVQFELFTPHLVIMHAIRNFLLVVMAIIYILPISSTPSNAQESVTNRYSMA
jgi:uncharacterized membrane protein